MPEAPATPVAPPATPPAAPPETPPTPPETPPETPPVPTPEQAAAITDEDPAAKITRLEAEVAAARKEAGKARINAKQTAADEARAELAQQIGKALGLVPEDVVDPVKLTEQVNASQAQAKQANVELAVFRAADAANGDASALLDSRTFLAKVADLDPTNSDALVAAIAEAVAENPRLGKTEPTPPGMKPNRAQGSSAQPPLGIDAQIAAAEQAGDTRTAIRLKSAKSVSTQ